MIPNATDAMVPNAVPFVQYLTTNSLTANVGEMPLYLENTGGATYTLPALNSSTAGHTVTAFVANAGGITINVAGGNLIYLDTNTGTQINSTTVGDSVVLVGRPNGTWYADSIVGTWTASTPGGGVFLAMQMADFRNTYILGL